MNLENEKRHGLKLFTPESTNRIYEIILNEKNNKKLQTKQDKKQSFLDYLLKLFGIRNKTDKNISCVWEKKPEKRLEVGKKLPKIYHKLIKPELLGVPLEELDDYYKNDHVRLKKKMKFLNFGSL